jgi:hypothetical protein
MENKNKMENEDIKKIGDLLMVNKTGIIKMIKDNSDKNSSQIDCNLISMINCFYGHLSVKQLNWILEKVKYIIRHNKKYIEYKGIKDIQFC